MMGELTKRQVKVKEHTRDDGTTVSEHWRRIRESEAGEEGYKTKQALKAIGGLGAAYLAMRGLNGVVYKSVGGTWKNLPKLLSDQHGYSALKSLDAPLSKLSGQQSFAVFEPVAYRHLQGKSYSSTLMNVEKAIKGREVEHGFIISKQGKILAGFRGDGSQVPVIVPLQGQSMAKRLTFTHNHPARAPYSGADLMGQVQGGIGRFRAVEPNGNVTQMTYRGGPAQAKSLSAQIKTMEPVSGAVDTQLGYLTNLARKYGGSKGVARLENNEVEWMVKYLDGSDEYRRMMTESYRRLEQSSKLFRYEELGRIVKRVNDVTKAGSYAPGMDQLRIEGEIAKVDDEQRQVFGWASVTEINGEPVVDLQNDYLETIELEKAAYDYVLHSRVGGEMHDRVKKDAPKQVGTLIESMVFTPEKIAKMGLPPETPRGWWIGFQVGRDDLGTAAWEGVKKGKYTGFSIHGLGKRIEKSMDEITKNVLGRSEQEIAGWIQRVSEQIGVEPTELAMALDEYFAESDGEVDDDDIHDFLMETFGSGQMLAKREVEQRQKVDKTMTPEQFLIAKAAERASSHDEFAANVEEIGKALEDYSPDAAAYFDAVHKHLIGRHEQQDHDPTKKGKKFGHKRSEHGGKWGKEGTRAGGKYGAIVGAGFTGGALLAARAAGMPVGTAMGALRVGTGALGGAAAGYQLGGGQIFGNTGGSRLGGVAAGTGNVLAGGFPYSGIRRAVHGDPNAYYAQQRHGKRNRKLSKRQREVLEKYLGPIEEDQ
jgi:hypothetical protein